MKMDDRFHALNILSELLLHHVPFSQSLSSSTTISPLTKELCYGFCRHYYRLQAMADLLIDKRPKQLDVWIAILLGLYQLQYMNKPEYAVVKETVSLVEKARKTWAKGLVNAVLRHFCRQRNNLLDKLSNNPAFLFGQPEWFLGKLKENWSDDWQSIALANDTHPPMVLRVNQRKKTVGEYLQLLSQSGIDAFAHPIASEGIILTTPCEVSKLPGFLEGWVSVQDGAAQLAVSLLSLKSGQRVLDACCAPGGKTCHILESHPDLAECVALDIDARRLQRVRENLDRLELDAKLLQADAAFPEQWWDGHFFDRILLDAPCSATGVIRRHPDIKILRQPQDVVDITSTQSRLLDALWPLLSPGGILVYATCSILVEENNLQIAAFLKKHSDCRLEKKEWAWGRATSCGQQILPGQQSMDGFFYSVLVKDNK